MKFKFISIKIDYNLKTNLLNMIIPVILSGGSGTRLWPLSKKTQPKQFIKLLGDKSLFYKTLDRVIHDKCFTEPLAICNESHVNFVEKEFSSVGIENGKILIEPVGRNTAPAIAAISLFAQENCSKDDVLLILSSDHYIREREKFIEYVKQGQKLAEQGHLVTFGVVPNKPETGYGYIKRGKKINEHAYSVDKFIEKPNFETALKFLDEGHYSWNCGIFMFKPSVLLKNIQELDKEMYSYCLGAYHKAEKQNNRIYLNLEDFEKCNDISIDYAVMEKTKDQTSVVPMNIVWSDVGSFESLYENTFVRDEKGNCVKGDVFLEEVENCYIRSETNQALAVVGLSDIAVIQTEDTTLVINKKKSQLVKKIVKQIKDKNSKYKKLI